MQKRLDKPRTAATLEDLGAVRVQGPDAGKFLQGQLSNDVMKLSAENPTMLAGFHNPHGRVIALLRLVWLGREDILAILPRELASGVAARLTKFVLRAKVKIVDDSAVWRVLGVTGAPPQEGLTVCVESNASRWWVITAANESKPLPQYAAADRASWRALDVAGGIAQVYAATSEVFVAQMLNLDALGAIAFDKGCYTGQEIIARAHYRGKVKRRMQRFRSHEAGSLRPGDAGRFTDGRAFKIVEIAGLADGSQELLAVAPLAAGEAADEAATAGRPSHPFAVETLPLPYTLGE